VAELVIGHNLPGHKVLESSQNVALMMDSPAELQATTLNRSRPAKPLTYSPLRDHPTRSYRSASITFPQAATKSRTNFSLASSLA
jgi:hypothetical protein